MHKWPSLDLNCKDFNLQAVVGLAIVKGTCQDQLFALLVRLGHTEERGGGRLSYLAKIKNPRKIFMCAVDILCVH